MPKAKTRADKPRSRRKPRKAPPAETSPPPKPGSRPPPRGSTRPGAGVRSSVAPSTGPESSRWEQRADKDAYALDLLERLVQYFTGRGQATNSAATHAAAAILSTEIG